MEQAATNLSEIAADSVNLWDAKSRRWADVREVFVGKGQITSPVTVSIPGADEVERFLAYPNVTSNQVPALDGMLAYIAQQQKLGAGCVTNRYVSVKRNNFFTTEGDAHITTKSGYTASRETARVHGRLRADVHHQERILRQKIVRPTIIFAENAGPM